MAEIIPALMPKNFADLKKYARQFRGLVDTIQVDVMDSKFVSETSWPYTSDGILSRSFLEIVGQERRLPEIDGLNYEFDLMVSNPEKIIKSWTQTGAHRLIFHIESIKDRGWFWKNLAHIKTPAEFLGIPGVEIGLAIDIETPNEEIYSHIDRVDFVQCMGIAKIGFQGQLFDKQVLFKIADLRKRFPELIISVDGGVSLETAPLLISAGASRLVSGSAILKSENIETTIGKFKKL